MSATAAAALLRVIASPFQSRSRVRLSRLLDINFSSNNGNHHDYSDTMCIEVWMGTLNIKKDVESVAAGYSNWNEKTTDR